MRVYQARVRTQYKYADYQEVRDYCDLKPDECATAKGVDDAIRSSHISGAQKKNYARAEQIDEQRDARIEAQKEAEQKFVQALTCATLEMGTEGAAAECRGQRVIRCKAQMNAIGSSWEQHCIETPPREE